MNTNMCSKKTSTELADKKWTNGIVSAMAAEKLLYKVNQQEYKWETAGTCFV